MRPPPELAQDLRHIVQESGRAARIVRNLLAFARRQAAERTPQDITDLVARVLSLRTYDLRLADVTLETAYEAGLPPVIADAGQVQQALLNLILNAEQALRGRARRVLRVCARFDEPASAVELQVSDTGHGIEETNLTRIFDPFFTTRDVGDGTGLGLSICYGIVRDHGGEIQAESSLNVGTTITLQLPARPAGPAISDDPILIAHPDKADLDFIGTALLAWGYTVACTTDGEEALGRYQAGGLHALLLNRGFVAGNPAAWSAARAADIRQVPVLLLARISDETDGHPFRLEQRTPVLTAPFQLRALRTALRAVTQEYA